MTISLYYDSTCPSCPDLFIQAVKLREKYKEMTINFINVSEGAIPAIGSMRIPYFEIKEGESYEIIRDISILEKKLENERITGSI